MQKRQIANVASNAIFVLIFSKSFITSASRCLFRRDDNNDLYYLDWLSSPPESSASLVPLWTCASHVTFSYLTYWSIACHCIAGVMFAQVCTSRVVKDGECLIRALKSFSFTLALFIFPMWLILEVVVVNKLEVFGWVGSQIEHTLPAIVAIVECVLHGKAKVKCTSVQMSKMRKQCMFIGYAFACAYVAWNMVMYMSDWYILEFVKLETDEYYTSQRVGQGGKDYVYDVMQWSTPGETCKSLVIGGVLSLILGNLSYFSPLAFYEECDDEFDAPVITLSQL
jgi:hypothetical protein